MSYSVFKCPITNGYTQFNILNISENELITLDNIENSILNGEFSNEFLVQLIELYVECLSTKTIPNYLK